MNDKICCSAHIKKRKLPKESCYWF